MIQEKNYDFLKRMRQIFKPDRRDPKVAAGKNEIELDSSWKTGNLSVAVLVMRPYNDLTGTKAKKSYPDYYIVNSVIVPLGTTKVMEYAN